MRLENVLGIARAEARLTRRLVRYWVFLALAFILVVGSYLYYAFIHSFFSSYSASVGAISPRYLIAGLGLWGMVFFMIGQIFLAFDVRSRDERERIVEVIESRPCTNLELVVGRFLGLLLMAWVPLVAMVALVWLLGVLGRGLGWVIGEPLEPWSVFAFAILMAIPAMSFILALVFLIALVFRNRLVTALGTLVLLVLGIVMLFRVPIDLVPLVDFNGAYSLNFPSELVPELFVWPSLVQRGSLMAAALGLLLLAAVAHPRLESGSRRTWALGGVAFLVLAAAGMGLLYQQAMTARARSDAWETAHEAKRDEPAPDVELIRGEVAIHPGRSLTGELEIGFSAPGDAGLEQALFTLNPGLEVETVTASGRALEFDHREGLLEVTLASSLPAGESSTLSLKFSGEPDVTFGYLDSAIKLSELKLMNANMILLGYNPGVFHSNYVALMPGVRWLPAAGSDVGRDDPHRATDFFRLDLTVELPEAWLAAGPGRRRTVDGAAAGRVRYRFAPPAPLPEAALVASRFESRSTEIAGVELELLLHPEHMGNIEIFEEAGEEIHTWIDEKLREAAEIGLPYPYDALTLVEVPTTLRGYGGGWRMDTAMAPPAMLLLRESSFPTVRFDTRFRKPEEFADREGGIARAKREVLQGFFESDFNGGNIFLGAARNFFLYQTSSSGNGSLALDFVCHDLANRLATDRQGFFSAHIFGPEFQQVIQAVILNYMSQREQGVSITEALLQAITERPDVWEQALGVSLAEMDPWEDPARTMGVLALKGGAMSRWILDGLGREKTGELLAGLRARATGRTFGRDDLMAVAEELEIDFESLTGEWLTATELPGFTSSEARLFRLPDEDGVPRYQVALDLRNGEPVPGLVRLRYRLDDGEESSPGRGGGKPWQQSEPWRVAAGEAVEMGLVLSKPPSQLQVAPYLALNRNAFAVTLPALDEEKIVEVEPLRGVQPSEWGGAEESVVVVDDLDPGFSVEQDETGSGFRLGGKSDGENLDQGLPVLANFQPPADWSRRAMEEAWGQYRHTIAVIKAGKGDQRAVFTAELERSGPWRLELFMLPTRASSRRWKRGTYHLTVEDPSGSQELTFDAGAAEEGWNMLGELEIASGKVRVALSNETDGGAVIADAVRWRPARAVEVTEETDG